LINMMSSKVFMLW
jgi:hypothetical protein